MEGYSYNLGTDAEVGARGGWGYRGYGPGSHGGILSRKGSSGNQDGVAVSSAVCPITCALRSIIMVCTCMRNPCMTARKLRTSSAVRIDSVVKATSCRRPRDSRAVLTAAMDSRKPDKEPSRLVLTSSGATVECVGETEGGGCWTGGSWEYETWGGRGGL